MSGKNFRAEVFSKLVTFVGERPGLEAYYENGPVPDLAEVPDHWLDVEIRYYGASTAAMGVRPTLRDTGAIVVRVFAREGSGTAQADDLVDDLVELLRPQRLGGAVLDAPERLLPTPALGWHKVGVLVPFKRDSL